MHLGNRYNRETVSQNCSNFKTCVVCVKLVHKGKTLCKLSIKSLVLRGFKQSKELTKHLSKYNIFIKKKLKMNGQLCCLAYKCNFDELLLFWRYKTETCLKALHMHHRQVFFHSVQILSNKLST